MAEAGVSGRIRGLLGTLGTALVIAFLSIFVLAAILAAGELIIRLRGAAVIERNAGLMVRMAELAHTPLVLAEPPLFVTDEHGIQVAYPLTPGTNAEGYRTPPFDEPANGRSTVMFLGDSFTWGGTARPLSLAYADRVRAAGYKVINLGVPATGPTQYAAQAARYVPALKPDVVCVMFFTDNDFELEADIAPGRTRTYVTNVGMFYAATPEGRALSPHEALAWGTRKVPWWLTPGVARVVTGSALGMWTLGKTAPPVAPAMDVERTLGHLRQVREACVANGARMELFLLPTRPESRQPHNEMAHVAQVLAEFVPNAPAEMSADYYRPQPDVHFNNAGHGVMAELVLSRLAALGVAPHPELMPDDTALYGVSQRPTVEEFGRYLSLSEEELDLFSRRLRLMDLSHAALYLRQPLRGPGQQPPAAFLADLMRADAASTRDTPAFVEYTEANVVSGDNSYRDMELSAYLVLFQWLGGQLDPARRLLLKRIPEHRFAAIRPFPDALLEKIAAQRQPDREMPWAAFAKSLDLNAEQAEKVKRGLNALKDDLVEVLSRPALGGGPAPLERMRPSGAAGGAPLAQQREEMMRYAQTARDAVEGLPYLEAYLKRAVVRQKEIFDVLSLDQQTAYTGLPIANFSKVNTGYDPLMQRLYAPGTSGAAAGPAEMAAPEGTPWYQFKASLNLRGEQEELVRAVIQRLRAEVAAQGADVEALEAAAAKELDALLDEAQRRRLRVLGVGSLRDVVAE